MLVADPWVVTVETTAELLRLRGYGVEAATNSSEALVAVSGYGVERDRTRSWEAGFDCHLVKLACPGGRAGVVGGELCTNRRMR
jgi:CheY-like chemotaxis protein